jgi:hypothetical protein
MVYRLVSTTQTQRLGTPDTAGTGHCTPPPTPGFRAAGHRIQSGRSPPESVQTKPPAPPTPDATLEASVVTSGDPLRHG